MNKYNMRNINDIMITGKWVYFGKYEEKGKINYVTLNTCSYTIHQIYHTVRHKAMPPNI
jgi:hypothetical protein